MGNNEVSIYKEYSAVFSLNSSIALSQVVLMVRLYGQALNEL